MIGWDILYEHDQQLTEDINGNVTGDAAIVPGEQAPVDDGHQGGNEQEEIGKASFDKELEKAYFHGEAVVVVAGKIIVIGLQPEEIGAEISTEKAASEDPLVWFHIAENLFVEEGAGIIGVKVLYMDKGLE